MCPLGMQIGDIALPGQKNAFQCFVTEKAVMAAQTLLSAENLSSIRLLSMPVESIRVMNCSEVKIAPLKEKEVRYSIASIAGCRLNCAYGDRMYTSDNNIRGFQSLGRGGLGGFRNQPE
jgi:hypothetical protein